MNEFDNDVSILYKEAQKLGIPTKFVKIDVNIVDNKEVKSYNNLISLIISRILAGVSLYDLYSQFSITPQDLAMIYYSEKAKKINPKEVLEEINQFYTSLELSEIRDVSELKLLFNQFRKDVKEEILIEEDELEDLSIIQEELSKNIPLIHSPINLTSIVLLADMTFKNKTPTSKDGYEIFDLSVTNSNLPYLKWNSMLPDTNVLYKLYNGKTLEDRPDYKLIVPDTAEKEVPNLFNFSVWSDKVENKSVRETKDITKESYLNGTYNLDKNIMKIKIPVHDGDEKNIIINRIESSLPLEFNKIVETTISGDFFIFNVEIDNDIFSHMLLNYELMNTYLFQKEISTPAALSRQLRLNYRGATDLFSSEIGSSVTFSINQNYAKGGEIVTVSDGQRMRLAPNFPYVRVNISSAESLETAKKFVKILSRLLNFYKFNKNDIRRIYNFYIPELKDLGKPKTTSSRKAAKTTADSKISRLQQLAPDLFISGYARKCLCPVQPIIIPDDEIDAWKAKKVTFYGKEIERQVMKFPPDNPKWNFVCPEDSYPFPGVKFNKDLDNRDEYTGLPCCFKKDQIGVSDSNYNKIYTEGKTSKSSGKGEHIVKTDKIAKINNFGLLPPPIVSLISQYSDEDNTILRMGVPRSINSLLHCVSVAINDKKYNKSKDKESYLEKLRTAIQRKTFPSLVKQEMYDFSDDEITSQLDDNEIFYDPNLFYRAVEESYNVNLYVFAPSSDEEKRLKTKSESIGVMELPRFKLVYSKSPRNDRACILVYRTLGSESDNLYYPQCELIVSQNVDNNQMTYVYTEEMNEILFPAYEAINKNIGWELVNNGGDNVEILGRENVFSKLNYFQLFEKYSPSEQYIDGYGKMRGLVINFQNNEIMLVLPPSQPENLSNISEIKRAPINVVLNLMNNPVAVSTNNGQIDGLWFTVLDLIYGVYVPIIPTNNTLNLPIGPSNPLGDREENIVPKIIKMKRSLDFTMQILKWLFILNLQKKSTSVEEFMNKYTLEGNGNNYEYDFTNVGRTFPEVKTVEGGIKAMIKRVPTLFKDYKVYLYSKKYYDGIKYILNQWLKERIDRYTKVPTVIKRIYLSQKDFIRYPEVSLFLSERDLRIWLSTLYKLSYENLIIDERLSISRALQTNPYLYQSLDGHIYYIQNVIQGNINRALNVGIYWDDFKINPGYKAEEYDGDIKDLKYVIYEISEGRKHVLVENKAGDSIDYISILRYSTNNYGAMLRLH